MRCVHTHLTEGAEVKAVGLGIARACVHVVAHEQHKFQQLAEGFALPHVLTRRAHRQHVRPHVTHLLLKLQLKQDGVQPRPQALHNTHLQTEKERDA